MERNGVTTKASGSLVFVSNAFVVGIALSVHRMYDESALETGDGTMAAFGGSRISGTASKSSWGSK